MCSQYSPASVLLGGGILCAFVQCHIGIITEPLATWTTCAAGGTITVDGMGTHALRKREAYSESPGRTLSTRNASRSALALSRAASRASDFHGSLSSSLSVTLDEHEHV